MKTLIIKRGAAGDVVRTTPLLHILGGQIYWVTDEGNLSLIETLKEVGQAISWEKRDVIKGHQFELVINLEDSLDSAKFLQNISYKKIFGAYETDEGRLSYSPSSSKWFDLSIISRHGKYRADELKIQNRKSYQDIIFGGLGYQFRGEPYLLPKTGKSELTGDIAIAPKSGDVWPMKNWAYFDELAKQLDKDGYCVNYLPYRETLLEHIADVRNHKYLISGDSLPMHIALGSGIKCLSIFICTSPWEIYDYNLQRKLVSPNLEKYFYKRDFDQAAVESVSIKQVYEAVISHINRKTVE
jgi:heptosyltransferase-2